MKKLYLIIPILGLAVIVSTTVLTIKDATAPTYAELLADTTLSHAKVPPGWSILTDGTRYAWKTRAGYVTMFPLPSCEAAVKGSWEMVQNLADSEIVPVSGKGWKEVSPELCAEETR